MKSLYFLLGTLIVFLCSCRLKQASYSSVIGEGDARKLAERSMLMIYGLASAFALSWSYSMTNKMSMSFIAVAILAYITGSVWAKIRMAQSMMLDIDSECAEKFPDYIDTLAGLRQTGVLNPSVCLVPSLPIWMTFAFIISIQVMGLMLGIILR